MKTAKIIYSILLFSFGAICLVNGQEKNEVTWRDRLFFGGNVSLSVGSETAIELTPLVGYRITPRWSAGVGYKYEYYKSSGGTIGPYTIPSYSTSIYGGDIFTNFVFLKNFPTEGLSLMGQAEYESLSLERKYFENPDATGRFIINNFLVGGGIRQRIGRRSSINMLLLWNLNETKNSPYSNPIIKFNFIF
jgi:hypothetical protein